MLKDDYRISSNFRPQKKSVLCNVDEFFKGFEDFYMKVKSRNNPDLPHTICDPYGFALLCEDYESHENEVDEDVLCKEAFENHLKTPYDSIFKFKFPFKVLLDLLFRA